MLRKRRVRRARLSHDAWLPFFFPLFLSFFFSFPLFFSPPPRQPIGCGKFGATSACLRSLAARNLLFAPRGAHPARPLLPARPLGSARGAGSAERPAACARGCCRPSAPPLSNDGGLDGGCPS